MKKNKNKNPTNPGQAQQPHQQKQSRHTNSEAAGQDNSDAEEDQKTLEEGRNQTASTQHLNFLSHIGGNVLHIFLAEKKKKT